jgi:regulator of protease activity HflC (stomatin/prohibitin superfamily)
MGKIKLIGLGIFAFIGFILFMASTYTVQEGHRGVITQFNELHSVSEPGLGFKVPFAQKMIEVDVRTQSSDEKVVAATNDQQNVSTTVNVNFHLDEHAIGEVYSKVGLAKVDTVISKRILETSTAVVAKYRAEDLLKQRELVKNQIVAQLSKNLQPYHIVVEDVQITEFRFSDAYAKSIENKQIAEQAALTAINNTRRVQEEAKQAIEKAKGEAEAIRIQSEAIRQNGGQAYIDLQSVKRWDGKLPVTIMGGNGAVPFINMGKQ